MTPPYHMDPPNPERDPKRGVRETPRVGGRGHGDPPHKHSPERGGEARTPGDPQSREGGTRTPGDPQNGGTRTPGDTQSGGTKTPQDPQSHQREGQGPPKTLKATKRRDMGTPPRPSKPPEGGGQGPPPQAPDHQCGVRATKAPREHPKHRNGVTATPPDPQKHLGIPPGHSTKVTWTFTLQGGTVGTKPLQDTPCEGGEPMTPPSSGTRDKDTPKPPRGGGGG